MAGTTKKKKTTTGKSTSSKSKKQTQNRKQETDTEFIRSEVFLIASFAAAILLFLSNFHLCGVAGDFLRQIQLGLFGSMGFVVPILLFVGTCFVMSNEGNPIAALKTAAAAVGICILCGLLEMIFGGGFKEGQKITEAYMRSAVSGAGGGLIGGLLAQGIGSVLGTVGTYLVLLVGFVICCVCVTEKSVVAVVKKGGGKAYQYAKEDAVRRKELYEEKREERKRLRQEQKVRGVDLNSTKLDDEYDEPEDDDDAAAETAAQIPEPVKKSADVIKPEPAKASSYVPVSGNIYQDTDSITVSDPYIDEEDDSIPFDSDDVITVSKALQEETAKPFDFEEAESFGDSDFDRDEVPWSQENEEVLQVNKDTRTLGEMEIVEDFEIPQEAKRVVTASGKIIESDTEALKKKLESKREEKKEEKAADGITVAEEIKQKEENKKEYVFPPTTLLKKGSRPFGAASDKEYKETAIKLQQTLKNFGVGVTVTNVSCGPAVTRYELHPEQGVKVSKIVGLADDIKLSLAAADIRIEAPIPGKSAVGIEVPNKENTTVYLRDLLESEEFKKSSSKVTFAVGKDIGGQVVVTDIAKMPHLLIAGATGSGKSVCINTLVMSIIFKSNPEDVKMIMVDPKVVELSVYNGIPHLLIPVVTDPKKASGALNWAVAEMMSRYDKFAEYNVRDLKGYNAKVESIKDIEDENKPKKMPQIIIIIDELADLMMVSPGEVEDAICRLAQLARAAGIHLVIATQRPSVNVITGLIKANVPSRIAFSVSSGVDSRTIIDMNGAEKLLGKGDMLFYPSGFPKPQRVQGAYVSDQEISKVVEFLTAQGMTADYNPDIESKIAAPAAAAAPSEPANNRDEYFEQAGKFIIEKERASIGMLQRMYKIGFNRAARIMDQLAEAGVVGEEEGTKPRKILMTMEEFENLLQQGL